jgi:hypothetical protein
MALTTGPRSLCVSQLKVEYREAAQRLPALRRRKYPVKKVFPRQERREAPYYRGKTYLPDY